jgi:hypothetical protein
MAKYWRAGVKDMDTNAVSLIYFSTEKDYAVEELTEWLEEELGFNCVNYCLRHLNIIEYISNILTCPISTTRTCFNYRRSVVIG